MGTPELGVPALEAVAGQCDVGLVITQPDRPKGRSGKPQPSPVKLTALRLGLSLAQPTNAEELSRALIESGPFTLGVVVAYGRILSPDVLDLADNGHLNLHFSLLPRWRGAAPVARALMAGDPMTGVTIFKLDDGLDTGPVLTARAVDIGRDETAGELAARLAGMGAQLLASVIDPYLKGEVVPIPQSDDGATYAAKLTPEDRPIDLSRGAAAIVDQVRALAPEPGATLDIDEGRHQILGAAVSDIPITEGEWRVVDGAPVFGTARGSVEISLIKPPGRNLQSGRDWVRGRQSSQGTVA